MSEVCSCGYPDCAVCACTKAERERDELRGQVVRLERIADACHSGQSRDSGMINQEYWERAQFVALLKENDHLRAALEKHGRHDLTCKASLGAGNPCSCGLAEALQGKEPA